MPTRKARPRARPRKLEGLERLNAHVDVRVGPTIYGDDEKQRAEIERFVEMWAELREEAIAQDHRLSDHWAYRVCELGAAPPLRPDPRFLATDADDDWRREVMEDTMRTQWRLADMARKAWSRVQRMSA